MSSVNNFRVLVVDLQQYYCMQRNRKDVLNHAPITVVYGIAEARCVDDS